jgi:hypothetical protein
VPGHEDVSGDQEGVAGCDFFEDLLEDCVGLRGAEQGLAMVTTEGDEVEVFGFLMTGYSDRHGGGESTFQSFDVTKGLGGTRSFVVRVPYILYPTPKLRWVRQRAFLLEIAIHPH